MAPSLKNTLKGWILEVDTFKYARKTLFLLRYRFAFSHHCHNVKEKWHHQKNRPKNIGAAKCFTAGKP
ncbi:MAG: hypothetical protein KAX63_03245, partial [Pseudomonas sp.]|nr:hypothetical protein [Pseudomonas sp.]